MACTLTIQMVGSLAFRRAILALFWGLVAVGVGFWALRSRSLTSDQAALGVAFTAIAALLTRWSSLETTRIEHDPAGTFVIGTAIAVGGAAAPVVLVAQAVVMGLTDGIAKRRHPYHVITNIGLMAAWHGLLAFLTGPIFVVGGHSFVRFIFSMAVVSALTMIFNYLTVALSAIFLYGSDAAAPAGGADQLKDIGLAVAMGTIIWASDVWGPAILALLIVGPVYASAVLRSAHRRAASLALEISARVEIDESAGPLPGHSRRVARMVGALLGEGDPASDRVALACWSHGPLSETYGHRCSGASYDEHLVTAIRSIPLSRRIERLVPTDGLPSHERTSQLIAAACAWDSRRLNGSPIRTPDDLIHTFGIATDIVDELIELDPGWVIPGPHMPSGTSTRR